MKRTQEEINNMKAAIARQRERLPERNVFGDNNWEKLDAMVAVLDDPLLWDNDAIFDRYGGDNTADDYDERDDELANELLQIVDWLDGQIEADEIVDDD